MSWFDDLSSEAKAEILSGALHELIDHTPSVYNRLSAKKKASLRQLLGDCSVLDDNMTEVDYKHIRAYFKELREKHGLVHS